MNKYTPMVTYLANGYELTIMHNCYWFIEPNYTLFVTCPSDIEKGNVYARHTYEECCELLEKFADGHEITAKPSISDEQRRISEETKRKERKRK